MKKIVYSLVLLSVLAGSVETSMAMEAESITVEPAKADTFKNAWNNHKILVISGIATPVVLGSLVAADIYANQARVLKKIGRVIRNLAVKAKQHPGYAAAILTPVVLAAILGGEALVRGENSWTRGGINKVKGLFPKREETPATE